uniref:Uncharacterized protein n=1 Tax=Strombidium inclinatum TaxID=197538 RepID=A0A7S3MYB4_9SPIT
MEVSGVGAPSLPRQDVAWPLAWTDSRRHSRSARLVLLGEGIELRGFPSGLVREVGVGRLGQGVLGLILRLGYDRILAHSFIKWGSIVRQDGLTVLLEEHSLTRIQA